MTYPIINKVKENHEVSEVVVDVNRDEFKDLVHDLANEIEKLGGVETVKIIRERKRNPVLKTKDGDKVYLKFDGNAGVVVLKLARQPIRSIILEFLGADEDPTAGHIGGSGSARSPTEPDYTEPEDYAGNAGDQTESENGPRSYEDAEFEEVRQGVEKTETSFVPPYTKEEAGYKDPAEDPSVSLDCDNCVHYVEGGGCKMVQGDINPDGYCEQLYSDFGFFGRVEGNNAYLTMAAWGDSWRQRMSDYHIEEVVDSIKGALTEKLS